MFKENRIEYYFCTVGSEMCQQITVYQCKEMKVTAVTFTNARSTNKGAAACVKTQIQDGPTTV